MSMKVGALSLAGHGRVLATRTLGAEVGRELRGVARNAGGATVVDFRGVDVASSVFLDELCIAIRSAIEETEQPLVLYGLVEEVRDTLELVVQRRGIVLTAVGEGEVLELVGGKRHLAETLEAAQQMGEFSAPDLAERLEVKLPNLHQRLLQLQAAGAVAQQPPRTGQRARVFAAPDAEQLVARSD